jgi:hypothetical protein
MNKRITLFLIGIIIPFCIYSQNIAGTWIGKLSLPTDELTICFNLQKAGVYINL